MIKRKENGQLNVYYVRNEKEFLINWVLLRISLGMSENVIKKLLIHGQMNSINQNLCLQINQQIKLQIIFRKQSINLNQAVQSMMQIIHDKSNYL